MDMLTYILSRRYAKKLVQSIESGFRFKGTVPTYADLPVTGQQTGDVWITEDTHAKWVWDGNSTPGQWIQNTDVNAWGEIYGDITNQADLITELNKRQNKKVYQTASDVTVNGKAFPNIPGTIFSEAYAEFIAGSSVIFKTFSGERSLIMIDAEKTNDGTKDTYRFVFWDNNTVYDVVYSDGDMAPLYKFYRIVDTLPTDPEADELAYDIPSAKALVDWLLNRDLNHTRVAKVFGSKAAFNAWTSVTANLDKLTANSDTLMVLKDESYGNQLTYYTFTKNTSGTYTPSLVQQDEKGTGEGTGFNMPQIVVVDTSLSDYVPTTEAARLLYDFNIAKTIHPMNPSMIQMDRLSYVYDEADKTMYFPAGIDNHLTTPKFYYVSMTPTGSAVLFPTWEHLNLKYLVIDSALEAPSLRIYKGTLPFSDLAKRHIINASIKVIDGLTIPDLTVGDITTILNSYLSVGDMTVVEYNSGTYATVVTATKDETVTLLLNDNLYLTYSINRTLPLTPTVDVSYDKKTFAITNLSTDLEYPSAKAVFKTMLNQALSTFTFTEDDRVSGVKDIFEITAKNADDTKLYKLTLEMPDDLVLEEREQTLKNKIIDVADNGLTLFNSVTSLDYDDDNEKEFYRVAASSNKERKGLFLGLGTREYSKIDINRNSYSKIEQMNEFMYYLEYDAKELDYDFAKKYLRSYEPIHPPFGCSTFCYGGYMGRNYDWYYNNTVEFIVRVNASRDRYSSIGVASNAKFEVSDMTDLEYSANFDMVPFKMLDGINEKGVCVSMNVVPTGDRGHTEQSYAGRDYLPVLMAPRYILDHCATAAEAGNALQNNFNIIAPTNTEVHLLITDPSGAVIVVEWINNVTTVINNAVHPWMTNFYINNAVFDTTTHKVDYTTVTDHGAGLERWDILADSYTSIDPTDTTTTLEEKIMGIMQNIWYTKAYAVDDVTDPAFWKTEFTGDFATYGDLKVTDPASAFSTVYNYCHNEFLSRSRTTSKTWHTVHTSVYDIANKKMYLVNQEDPTTKMEFDLYTSLVFASDDEVKKILGL